MYCDSVTHTVRDRRPAVLTIQGARPWPTAKHDRAWPGLQRQGQGQNFGLKVKSNSHNRLTTCRRASGYYMLPVTVCPANSPTTWTAGRRSTCSVQAIVIDRLSYASPAWWGFVSADDRHRLKAFLYADRQNWVTDPTVRQLLYQHLWYADNQLFDRITGNSQHLLHPLRTPSWAWTALESPWTIPQYISFLDEQLLSMTKTLLWGCCIKTWHLMINSILSILSFYYNFIDWLILIE